MAMIGTDAIAFDAGQDKVSSSPPPFDLLASDDDA